MPGLGPNGTIKEFGKERKGKSFLHRSSTACVVVIVVVKEKGDEERKNLNIHSSGIHHI